MKTFNADSSAIRPSSKQALRLSKDGLQAAPTSSDRSRREGSVASTIASTERKPRQQAPPTRARATLRLPISDQRLAPANLEPASELPEHPSLQEDLNRHAIAPLFERRLPRHLSSYSGTDAAVDGRANGNAGGLVRSGLDRDLSPSRPAPGAMASLSGMLSRCRRGRMNE